jgi:uncharacterized membrane protein
MPDVLYKKSLRLRFGLIVLLLIVWLILSASLAQAQSSQAMSAKIDEQFVVGKVLSVSPLQLNKQLWHSAGMVSKHQLVNVEIMEGSFKGMRASLANEITDNPAFNVNVKPGSEVILSLVTGNEKMPDINIADYHRVPTLAWLLVVFLATFLFFGGKNGLKSLVGLLISIALIACVLLPMSIKGVDPLITATCICLISTVTAMLLVGGFSKKAAAAIIGTVGGVLISGVAAHLVIVYAPLTGLSSEEAQILRASVLGQRSFFYTGLLAAGMLIGALGVIMDVGISVASAVFEVSKINSKLSSKELYDSGMNVGRDIMGTMTNTLILAYAGGALPLLLLTSQMPWIKLLNLDLVATEVAAALTGSLGLVCAIPLTSLAAALLISYKPQVTEKLEASQLFTQSSFVIEPKENS